MEINKEVLKEIRVLYVEDEDDVRDFTSRTIANIAKELIEAENGLVGLEKFKERFENKTKEKFDIIVTDINMPKMNGLEMCEKIQEIDSSIPIVITTAHNDTDFLKSAINLGVRGYAMKPVDLRQLIQSITIAAEPRVLRKELESHNKILEHKVEERTIELKEMVEKLEKHSEELLYEATHDNLTTLYNRQKLNKELTEEIERHNRYQHDLSMIMFDIDFFKQVNDTYGHDIGDEVLVSISTLSLKHVRHTDTLARWGGEEFMLLLPETSLDEAQQVAEKLRTDIDNTCLTATKSCHITASFGITTFKSDDDKTIFLKRVDEALYEAKDTGRNKVVIKK